MKKLSIVIMAHPSRAKFIPYLKEMLGDDIPVVFDEKNNIWDTCRRAWFAQDFSCEYGVVIQDDCIITRNFRKKAEKLLTEDFIYSFYAGEMLREKIRIALHYKSDRVISSMIFNEVALCMKMSRVKDMVKFCDEREAQTDHEIVKYARSQNLKVCYTLPSLVDHRDTESIWRKMQGGKVFSSKPRKAVKFLS
jgi:hypothetical protein